MTPGSSTPRYAYERDRSHTYHYCVWTGLTALVPTAVCVLLFLIGVTSAEMARVLAPVGWLMLSSTLLCHMAYAAVQIVKYRGIDLAVPLFFSGVFVFVGAEPFVVYLTGREMPGVLHAVTATTAVKMGLIVSTYLFMAVFVIAFPPHKPSPMSSVSPVDGSSFKRGLLLGAAGFLFLSMVPFVFFGPQYGGGVVERMVATAIRARSEGYLQFPSYGAGSEYPVVLLLGQCSIVAALIAAFVLVRFRNRMLFKVMAWTIFVVATALTLSGGGRTRAGFILMTLVIFLALVGVRNRASRSIVLVGIILLVAPAVAALQLTYRTIGWDRIGEETLMNAENWGHSLNRDLAVIAAHYDEGNYVGGRSFAERLALPMPRLAILFVTNPVPRTVWPDKPIDPSFEEYNYLRTGQPGTGQTSNVTATVMGRAYMNYGLLGVVQIGFLMGVLWRWAGRYVYYHRELDYRLLVACMFMYYLIESTRELSPGWLYPVVMLYGYGFLSRLVAGRVKWHRRRATAFGPQFSR